MDEDHIVQSIRDILKDIDVSDEHIHKLKDVCLLKRRKKRKFCQDPANPIS